MLARRYIPWLLALTGLFVFRVLAHLVQTLQPVLFLPPLEAWHGAVLRYSLLLACQVVIIVCLSVITWRVGRDAVLPRPWKFRLCFALGVPYFLFMAVKLAAGPTFLADHPWFAKSLPAFFHFVLASFLLLLGHYIYKSTGRLGPARP